MLYIEKIASLITVRDNLCACEKFNIVLVTREKESYPKAKFLRLLCIPQRAAASTD